MAVKRYKGDGYALYNGKIHISIAEAEAIFNKFPNEELFDIPRYSPDTLFSDFTHIFILNYEWDQCTAKIMFCATEAPIIGEDGTFGFNPGVKILLFRIEQDADYSEDEEGNYKCSFEGSFSDNFSFSPVQDGGATPIWSNFTETYDHVDGTLVFEESEAPIPLDGMNVIEWNGSHYDENTGEVLWNNGDGSYIIAKQVPIPTNAIAVFNGRLCTEFYGYGDGEWELYDNNEDSDYCGSTVASGRQYSGSTGRGVNAYFYDEEHYTSLIVYTPVEEEPEQPEEPKTATITYHTEHGTAPEPYTVILDAYGEYPWDDSMFPVLTAEGYIFKGWSTDEGQMSEPTGLIEGDVELYAIWEAVVEPEEPTDSVNTGKRFLYNGVELPDINEVWTDKETYPYAIILDTLFYVYLFITAEPAYKNSYYASYGINDYHAVVGSSYIRFRFEKDVDTEWCDFYKNDEASTLGLLDPGQNFVWASHDVYYDTGSLANEKSDDPIPVGGATPDLDPTSMLLGWLMGKRLIWRRLMSGDDPVVPDTVVAHMEGDVLYIKSAEGTMNGNVLEVK